MKKAPAVKAGACGAVSELPTYAAQPSMKPGNKAGSATPTRYLSGTECARRLGIEPTTWRGYWHRRLTPPPDAWIGDVAGWLPETVDGWQRPGQGARTDVNPDR